jgi:hypothetical protein
VQRAAMARRVLPTSSDDGMIEFVPSTSLAAVLRDHRTIHRFLLAVPDNADTQGACSQPCYAVLCCVVPVSQTAPGNACSENVSWRCEMGSDVAGWLPASLSVCLSV